MEGSTSNDLCNTGLDLGLGLMSSPISDYNYKIKRPSSPPPQSLDIIREPSLTLSLSAGEITHVDNLLPYAHDDHTKGDHIHHKSHVDQYLHRQDSAAASSFSNNLSVIKRERSGSDHEFVELDQKDNLCKVSGEDIDDINGSNGRKKLRLTKAQSALLEESFKHHSTLNPKQKQELARELKLRPRQVEVWFQNRRARTKLKQTEVECEFLKKCCENLTEENRRLRKQIQELKTLNLAHHRYMQCQPAETLATCPSCHERSSIGAAENKTPCTKNAPKSNFYSHFIDHPSAACYTQKII